MQPHLCLVWFGLGSCVYQRREREHSLHVLVICDHYQIEQNDLCGMFSVQPCNRYMKHLKGSKVQRELQTGLHDRQNQKSHLHRGGITLPGTHLKHLKHLSLSRVPGETFSTNAGDREKKIKEEKEAYASCRCNTGAPQVRGALIQYT